MNHEDHAESIGAYALGAMPALEEQIFERHLMRCETCQDELQRLQEAADALPRSVTPYEAPASLKETLMEVVNAEASRKPARQRRQWLPRFRPAMAFATATACALAFVAGSQVDTDDEPRTVAAQVDGERLPEGSASLLIPSNDDRGAVLRVQGLPDPGRDRVYQVWVQRGSEVVPVSSFNVDSKGSGAAAIPESLDDVNTVMVTREDRAGVMAPTEVPVMTVDT